jgi:alkylation response protein AidB-like acyl-CoA dehydrogenase
MNIGVNCMEGSDREYLQSLRGALASIDRSAADAASRTLDVFERVGLFDLSDDLELVPYGEAWSSELLLECVRAVAASGNTVLVVDIIVARRLLLHSGQREVLEATRAVSLSHGSQGRELVGNVEIADGVVLPSAELAGITEVTEPVGLVPGLAWCRTEQTTSAESGDRELDDASQADWRALTSAMLLGLADRALRLGSDYVKERHQFGRPIAAKQAVSHRFADLYTARRAVELLIAEMIPDRRTTNVAFAFAARQVVEICRGAQHVFGGYGVSEEYEIGHLTRRALAAATLGRAHRVGTDLGHALLKHGRIERVCGESEAAVRSELAELFDRILTEDVRQECLTTGSTHHPKFFKELADAGWVGGEWPKEYGGCGRRTDDVLLMFEEASLRRAPMTGYSVTMIAARTILRCGTEEQRQRFLPQVAAGDIAMSIGFTEPEAGSDVANCRTRGRRNGDTWIIDGQKVFTSCAQFADYVLLLTRTGDNPKKHKRLSLFLVPTDQPGFTAAPVWLHGGSRINITYYDGVKVPDANRIGEVDEGWRVLTTALSYERGLDGPLTWKLERLCIDLARWAGDNLSSLDGDRQVALAELAGELQVAAAVSRAFMASVAREASAAAPAGIDGAMAKLFESEIISHLTVRLLPILEGVSVFAPSARPLVNAYYEAIPTTIPSGCSEVQRDIIAERGYDFPRGDR